MAGFLTLKTPEKPDPAATPIFDLSTICKANREDIRSLRAQLSPAPVMSFELAQFLIAGHKGPGPAPVLGDNPDGSNTMILRWLDDQGSAHREGGPATIVFDPIKNIVIMDIWSLNGLMHRTGGKPASTEWDPVSGRVIAQTWREGGKMHNPGGPALRMFDWDQNILTQRWHFNDDVRRLNDGPTYTKTDMGSENVILEEWETRIGDSRLIHRADGIHKIEHDGKTGISTRKLYNFHDMQTHSDQINYEIRMNRHTGSTAYEEWKKNDITLGYVTYTPEGEQAQAYPDAQTVNRLRTETKALQEAGGHYDHHKGHSPQP